MTRSDAPMPTAAPAPRALLLAVQTQLSDEDVEHSLAELRHLLEGLGIPARATVIQKRQSMDDVHVLGRGKLEELKQLLADEPSGSDAASLEQAPWIVVFDGDLSPGQQRFLNRELGVQVVDRTQVILNVFRERARTRIAQLEIELARLEYEAPRVRDDENLLARQAGGGGRGERGHTSAELRKQQLRRRMSALRSELQQAQLSQESRRARRQQVARAALVGYTNAGKSSWMRALTKSGVKVENKLFATLDTTVRTLQPVTSPRVVIADTVGFLRRLPNHLLASFRSTLAEALDADLLLLVVDAADPEWQTQLQVTRQVLADVSANETPCLVLLNKCDKLAPDEQAHLAELMPEALQVSARSGSDRARVRDAIIQALDARRELALLSVPYRDGALLSSIRRDAHVLSESFDEVGVKLELRARPEQLAAWRKKLLAAPGGVGSSDS